MLASPTPEGYALQDPDELDGCPVRDLLDRIGEKWTVAVLHRLRGGPRRFTQVMHGVPGISQRMLTVTLRNLERDGLVSRTVHPVVPPRVDYELTPRGRTLLETLCVLRAWSLAHMEDIEQSRKEYDARHGR